MNQNDNDINEKPSLDDLISLSEASEISGLSPDHLRRLAGEGALWAKKIGRNWVTTENAVLEYLARDLRLCHHRWNRGNLGHHTMHNLAISPETFRY